MEISLLLVCFFVTITIGWSVLNLVLREKGGAVLLEGLSLSFGIGMGAVAIEMLIFYFLRLPLSLINLVLPWIPVALCSFIFSKRTITLNSGARAKLTLFEKLLLAGIVFQVALVFFRAFLKPLESFDSIAMYAMRSKIIFLGGMIPRDFFTDITLRIPNPDYPLLLPLVEVWIYTFLGSINDLLVKAVFPAYLLSFLVIFFSLLKRVISRTGAFLFTFILATIPQFVNFATVGYTDIILAYYYSIGMIYLFLWMKGRKTGDLVIAGLFSGFAAFTKNEGIMLFFVNIILLLLYFVKNLDREMLKKAAVYVLVVALIAAPWAFIRFSNGLENDLLKFKEMGAERFVDIFKRLDRIPVILYEYQKQFFGPKKWNIVWILFLGLFVLNIKRAFNGDLKYFSLSIFLILFFYGSVYMLIPVDGPINWYIASGVSRLFIHFVPIAVFWLALLCGQKYCKDDI
ncbi:MAG: glycosyltransferase family 39 protein [Candidatus Omnitrophota bacterium]